MRAAADSAVASARRGGNGGSSILRRFAWQPPTPCMYRLGPTSPEPSKRKALADQSILLANNRAAPHVRRMPRRPASITQADVRRVTEAARR